MERGVSINVLKVKGALLLSSEQVNQSNFRVLETCPMQWSRTSVVFTCKIHFLNAKEEKTYGLVSLSCNVEHIKTICVFLLLVCFILKQSLAEVDISTISSVVKSSELIFGSGKINPFF